MTLSLGDFSHVESAALRGMLGHWLEVRRGRAMPGRADIDPAAIYAALPFAWLCDYERETRRFRYRLISEHAQAAHRARVVGRYLDEVIPADSFAAVNAYCLDVVEEPCILHMVGRLYAATAEPSRGERLLLPLASDGRTADMLFGATIHSRDSLIFPSEPPPDHQMRTFTPLDGRPARSERR